MADGPIILFTAFEPSGDQHAAVVIEHLKQMRPDARIYALGGPKMEAAGAELIEHTTSKAAMLGSAIAKAREHRALLKRLERWMAEHPVAVHVPTDSPAANWSICKLVKRNATKIQGTDPGADGSLHSPSSPGLLGRVVHLVCPQVWAWASWRVRRLQKWSDLVLCILPFEPDWLAKHGVAARFIGHPLLDEPLDTPGLDAESAGFPSGGASGGPRLALLPGSRPGEIRTNFPLMLETLRRLRERFPKMTTMIAAANGESEEHIRRIAPQLPPDTHIATGVADAVIHWSDVVLVASGTATLHVARHVKPMVIVYRVNPWTWRLIGRFLIDTRTFTLPNLIAAGGPHRETERHIVREFVPFLGSAQDAAPVVDEVASLIEDEGKRQRQVEALRGVLQKFEGHDAGKEAAEAILDVGWGRGSI